MLNLSSMAMLALFEKAIERLTRLRPTAWHLVAAADDKCRAKPIKRIKRSREVDRVSGKDVPDVYSEQEPLSIYFKLVATFGDVTGSSSSGGVGDGGLWGAYLAPDENMPALHLPSGQLALEPQLEWSRTNRRKQHEATEQRRAAKVQELQQMRAWRQARVHTRRDGKSSTIAGTTCRTWAQTWQSSVVDVVFHNGSITAALVYVRCLRVLVSSFWRELVREDPRVTERAFVKDLVLKKLNQFLHTCLDVDISFRVLDGLRRCGVKELKVVEVSDFEDLSRSRDGRQKQCPQAVTPKALSISRVRPRALFAGRLCQQI